MFRINLKLNKKACLSAGRGFIQPFSNKRAGFTIIEVLAAVFIISIGIVGVVGFVPRIISGSSINSSKITAAYLAQEGLEQVRKIRDGNWLELSASWDEGLVLPGVDCRASAGGCEIEYSMLANEDPVLVNYTQRKLKVDLNSGYNYSLGSESKFKRQITIDKSGDYLLVFVQVTWEERGISYNFSAQEKLYKWR